MESIYQLIKILEGNKIVMFMCCVCIGATHLVLLVLYAGYYHELCEYCQCYLSYAGY